MKFADQGGILKVSIAIGDAASGRPGDFEEQVEYVLEAEKLGVDTVWSAEAWGQDAVAPLAYLLPLCAHMLPPP